MLCLGDWAMVWESHLAGRGHYPGGGLVLVIDFPWRLEAREVSSPEMAGPQVHHAPLPKSLNRSGDILVYFSVCRMFL
jgi:hypothetical protein